MSLAEDLLEQAGHLAVRDAGRPRQASLRRAISTAYYSLFHLIVDDAASLLARSSRLRSAVARGFDHKNLRSAAQSVGEAYRGPTGTQGLRPFLQLPVSIELAEVCDVFVNLQEHRHRAALSIFDDAPRILVQRSRINVQLRVARTFIRPCRANQNAACHVPRSDILDTEVAP